MGIKVRLSHQIRYKVTIKAKIKEKIEIIKN